MHWSLTPCSSYHSQNEISKIKKAFLRTLPQLWHPNHPISTLHPQQQRQQQNSSVSRSVVIVIAIIAAPVCVLVLCHEMGTACEWHIETDRHQHQQWQQPSNNSSRLLCPSTVDGKKARVRKSSPIRSVLCWLGAGWVVGREQTV